MSTLTFDTLKFANRLKAAGMEPRLAEEQADAMSEVLERHQDEAASKQDMLSMSAAMLSMEARFNDKLLLLEQRMTIKLAALMVASVGIVATLVKLL